MQTNSEDINDYYGHTVGISCAARWPSVASGASGNPTILERYGGEEFAILLPDTDTLGARMVAERLRSGVARHPVVTGRESSGLAISPGVATHAAYTPLRDLLEHADGALDHAKQNGRNRVESAPRW